MKIRKALFIDFDINNKWVLNIKDDDDYLISFIAIPPTNGNRTDIYLEKIIDGRKHEYIYDFKGNLKKIKDEYIAIIIENGIPKIITNI